MLQDRKEKNNRKNDRLIHEKLVYSNVKKIDSKGFKRKKKNLLESAVTRM